MTVMLRKQRDQECIEDRTPMIEWRDDDSALLDDETKIGRIEYAFFVYGRFVPTARVAEMRQLKTGSVRPRLIATDSR